MQFKGDLSLSNGTRAAKWAKIILRTIGGLNAFLALLGSALLASNLQNVLNRHQADPATPYFWIAFWMMTTVNVAFLCVLVLTAVRFIRARVSAINHYSLAVLFLFVYQFGIGMVWRAAGSGRLKMSIALSVAGATGVGDSGVTPFEFLFVLPFLYPLISVILVQVIRKRAASRNRPGVVSTLAKSINP